MTPVDRAALQAQVLHTPAYAENVASGTSTFALSYGARDVGTVRTELGARFDQTITVDANATLVLRSQAEPGVTQCRVAMRLQGQSLEGLVAATERVAEHVSDRA
jgi:hypothetical protein